ncbi:MAG: CDP-diacylglycerol--glycerol-3-phosphate 3-phosphatidyltransferase [Oscillospiraceae bacterium]|nr:CDP-diacylglycerol--glycerol-3-phosphate 3-phosphatidyltransferase [Oscillospiraceae bacterium]
MNLANKLTLLRIALVPVFLIVLYWGFPFSNWVALLVFIIASVTDFLDGHIARSRNMITDFGKFMDPLADKMLVMAAMCWFVQSGEMWGWVLALVLLREFAVSGMRLVAVEQGKVIAAAWSGKIKTASTMVCICLMLAFNISILDLICQIIILVTTLYSGAEYLIKNREVFAQVK